MISLSRSGSLPTGEGGGRGRRRVGQNCIIFFSASSAFTFAYLSDTVERVSQLESVVSFFIQMFTFIVEFDFTALLANEMV